MAKVPSVGRSVHYTSYGTPNGEYPRACRAATVTAVRSHSHLDLFVMNPNGTFHNDNVPMGEPDQGGTWHWPEYVPESE